LKATSPILKGRNFTRAVGAMFVSPALQRGVSDTNKAYGVP